ncbi:helix-turn-helix domain-containing protein [Amycolatopsis sp. DSM 110486]|uniref:helix-turn-helix domain-containing protein n=1 Tax=Amycolatopsis sp. DSM 110486 TaxID=2865832 RepID=UPI001C695FE7|nr:helix-turn-helix domain-containing protein [Amycolatopsis sp. DSM 110486]QYN23748.1 helix-turn-helix domain-containing protein [Amycolatopsis sp. DSM 110486]
MTAHLTHVPDRTSADAYTLLSVEAAAQRLSIGRTTMYGLIKTGQIASIRIGHLRRVPATAITDYINQLTAAQAA